MHNIRGSQRSVTVSQSSSLATRSQRRCLADSSPAILLDAGARISPKDDDYRSTPLAWAARNGLPDMVEFLLSRGAATNLPDDEPWATPLAWATRRGHHSIVELLRVGPGATA